MSQIAEYADIEGQELSKRITIKSSPSKINNGRNIIHLVQRTPGWTTAGSAARYDEGGFGVYIYIDGTTYGQGYKTREEAERAFMEKTT